MEKLFELIIDEEDESGVSQIALVDLPAIERNFQKFNQANKITFKVADEDKRIASGYAMVADLPIYRYDEQVGDHYVVFRKPTIEKIVNKFMKQGLNAEINLMHNSPVKDVYVFESLLIDLERGVTAPDGFQDAPDGSWFVSMRVDNDKVWEDIKKGTYKGFSVEGMFAKEEAIPTDEQIIDAAIDAINGE
jgi:hypothetical protein